MDYSKMTKEQLIQYIEGLNEQNNGKYGLVWDREKEPEKIVVDCDKKIPILKEIKKKSINNGGQNNILIEGDNFHALSVLNYTHKESIDVIYIDPPYNTKNGGFMYNDTFINHDNEYKHSKWLNFIEKRIQIARGLLKEKGVIFISIDDNEQAQLKLLCDRIFGESNFISSFVWQKKSGGGQAKYFYEGHEYVLIYCKNKELVDGLTEKDEKTRKTIQINGIEYQYESDFIRKSFGKYEKGTERRLHYEDIEKTKGIKKREEIDKMIANREAALVIDEKTKKHFVVKLFPMETKRKKMYSIFSGFWTSDGNTEIENFGLKFDNPKPVEMIKKIVDATNNKNAIVLDFFAGSGTTGQAVLELNAEDGGNRKFILCTNNENNICEEVTYPRLKTVITGKREDKSKYSDGLKGSLQYFKTDFVDKAGTKDQLYYDLTEKCIPMLCVKGDTYDLYKNTEEYAIYTNEDKSMFSCVYFDVLGKKYKEFLKEIKKIKEPKLLYIFNLGDYIDLSDLKEIDNYSVESIPYKIIELYNKIVKMSKGE